MLLERIICDFAPRLICYTAVSTQYDFIAGVAAYVANHHPKIIQMIGGSHASLNPRDVITGPFNALCVGEGEFPTLEFVSRLEADHEEVPGGIANLWVKCEGKIERNPPRPFLKDLGILPFPDRDIWTEWLVPLPNPRYSVLLGRGCPFECTYCSNHALKRLAAGPYVRYRLPDSILSEIQDLVARFPTIHEIYLETETIGLHRDWILDLCAKLETFNIGRRLPVTFGTNIRIIPECDFSDIFAAMSKAHFSFINIGLESGSERVRREILHRNYSNEDLIRTVTQARAQGLRISLYNLIGIPGETVADFELTVRMNRICRPDWHFTSIFYPYPGTRLHSLCEDRGLLGDRYGKGRIERVSAILDLPEFPRREIEKKYTWFNYAIYKGIRPLYRILPSVAQAKLRRFPRLLNLLRRMRGKIKH
jgi:anaerobic magnesium-protoporphyrin IX monomethyl ester cyclase